MRSVKLLSATLLSIGPAASVIEKPKHTVIQTFGASKLRQVLSYLLAETREVASMGSPTPLSQKGQSTCRRRSLAGASFI